MPIPNSMKLSGSKTRLALFCLRQDTKLLNLNAKRLHLRNRYSRESVVRAGGPVVSMTTFGNRLYTAYLALESIAAGSMLPGRLLLWIDDATAFAQLPEEVRRLAKRGLEVRATNNYGPHTKYYPYLLSADSFDTPLVTADDDVMYSHWWLDGLVRAYKERPDWVNCYRAHVIEMEQGRLAPYKDWHPCYSTAADKLNFATGVSGCIYPPELLNRLKDAGLDFLQCCPNADDVWLHLHALRGGFQIRQIRNSPMRFPLIPDTQNSALFHSNVRLCRNDEQLKCCYKPEDLTLLTEKVISQVLISHG